MARAGFLTFIEMSGTPTIFTDAATTDLGSNRFQVADSLKRVLSTEHAVSVSDGGTPLAADAFTVDYFFGIVTLESAPTGAVTVSARYLPMSRVIEATGVVIDVNRAELETNHLGTDYANLILGRRAGVVTIESTRLAAESIDSGAEITEVWEELHNDEVHKLLSVDLGGRTFRMWGVLPGLPQSAPQDGVIAGTREFKSVIRPAFGRTEVVSYGFGT